MKLCLYYRNFCSNNYENFSNIQQIFLVLPHYGDTIPSYVKSDVVHFEVAKLFIWPGINLQFSGCPKRKRKSGGGSSQVSSSQPRSSQARTSGRSKRQRSAAVAMDDEVSPRNVVRFCCHLILFVSGLCYIMVLRQKNTCHLILWF